MEEKQEKKKATNLKEAMGAFADCFKKDEHEIKPGDWCKEKSFASHPFGELPYNRIF